jgi:hypothetical protein
MAVVYITQEVRKATREGSFQPQFNFKPAMKYGELRVLVPGEMSLLSPVPLVRVLREKLLTFSEDDWLVAVGDPAIVATASMIIAQKTHGKLKILKWDRELRDYIPIEIDISGRAL